MSKEMVIPTLSVQELEKESGFLATISVTGDETKVTGASVTEVGAIGVALQNLELAFMDKSMTPIGIGVRLYRRYG